MTDRQILAAFFPDLLSGRSEPRTYRDIFVEIGRRQKLTDREIENAWERQYG